MLTGGRSAPAFAQAPEEDALARLFTSEAASADWFTPELLAEVPLADLQAIIDGVRGSLGGFVAVEPVAPGEYTVRFTSGSVAAQIALDAEGRIAGLFFGPPQFADPEAGLQSAVEALRRCRAASACSSRVTARR